MRDHMTAAALILFTFSLIMISCNGNESKSISSNASISDTTMVDLWNGNRSQIRQVYEKEVLAAVLKATEEDFGPWEIKETLDEYPGDDEALVFSEKGHDLFVTIAGNQKFEEGDMIVIPKPMTKNLLGYRVPIIREGDSETFKNISNREEVQQLKHGIPETWSDAVIFRENGYQVVEDGDFDDIFVRLENDLFDYTAFGANEVMSVYENRASQREGLTIDQNILIFYPFPLVFYVNPDLSDLAVRVEEGMERISDNGELDSIFNRYYGDIVEKLNLNERILFELDNPLIPDEFRDLKPNLGNL
ncbi:MAG: hypothetical protein R6V22_04660 [Rhodohalobacter sp.]|uniref:hypothetical protein n=1 Tax=Rhodohalobacter sp. TaxID=1974210 RepID=UPI00397676AA